ncbi:MAG: pyridoxamine 5'-phosphate oxidase family protein [Nitrosopumilus sp.]|nr:pyridoxamine 5'-phosphate oxidase family protein [Nitrosopumilus sp.]MDH3825304.1 pyridoxamine 5'-phosphate oxidase family protein [Nitrosopumilus sp.]
MQKVDRENNNKSVYNSKIPIRLACIKPNGMPSIVSLWYVQIDGKIYCATQKSAKIVSYLKKNPLCGFEIAGDNPPYKGTRGEGTVEILDKGEEILAILIQKYLGEKKSILSKFLRDNSKTEVAIQISPQKIFNYDYSKRMKDV